MNKIEQWTVEVQERILMEKERDMTDRKNSRGKKDGGGSFSDEFLSVL